MGDICNLFGSPCDRECRFPLQFVSQTTGGSFSITPKDGLGGKLAIWTLSFYKNSDFPDAVISPPINIKIVSCGRTFLDVSLASGAEVSAFNDSFVFESVAAGVSDYDAPLLLQCKKDGIFVENLSVEGDAESPGIFQVAAQAVSSTCPVVEFPVKIPYQQISELGDTEFVVQRACKSKVVVQGVNFGLGGFGEFTTPFRTVVRSCGKKIFEQTATNVDQFGGVGGISEFLDRQNLSKAPILLAEKGDGIFMYGFITVDDSSQTGVIEARASGHLLKEKH